MKNLIALLISSASFASLPPWASPLEAAKQDAQSSSGRVFESRAQKYFLENDVISLNKCAVVNRGGKAHDGVLYIDHTGTVRMIYVTPADAFGTCVRTRLLGSHFLPPPTKIYHLHVQLENALKQRRAKE